MARTLVLLAVLACSGCLVPGQLGTSKQDEPPPAQDLIKPVIPDETPKAAESRPDPQVRQAESLQPSKDQITPSDVSAQKSPQGKEVSPQPKPKDPGRVSRKDNKDEPWDDQMVKDAALKVAKSFPATKKIKICLATKDDEWWVTLYEDVGSYYELRQFVWDSDRKKLQPFLVLKRIDHHQLNEHVAASEPDRACEALDPLPRAAGEDTSPPEF